MRKRSFSVLAHLQLAAVLEKQKKHSESEAVFVSSLGEPGAAALHYLGYAVGEKLDDRSP